LLPLIYTNSTAGGIFLAACTIWIVPEAIGMLTQTARVARKGVSVRDRGSMGLLIGLQWVGLALNFSLAGFFRAGAISWHRTALFAIGVACILLGVGLRWYAIRTLGSYFTRDIAVSADQHVVQNGPYRFVRHPAYSGTFLSMLGIGIAMSNWASLTALLACVFVGYAYRVGVEEQALVESIGQPYEDYKARTKRFFPWVF
jgi:protein-S-isoprenylcysteine O-methyltransferase Ste14